MLKTNRTEINWIIYEYLREELKSKGLDHWPLDKLEFNENELNLSVIKRKQVIKTLCKLSHSICTSFNDNLNQMCLNIQNYMNENLSNLVELDYESFKSVADELFSDKIKWIHIIILLLFSTKLILFKLNDSKSSELTKNICQYLSIYINDNLLNWINDHQGWHGFLIEYFDEDHATKTNSITSKLSWSSTKLNKIDCTIGFLGFAIGFGILTMFKH